MINLALNITRLVFEASTGWKLFTIFSKCIDCSAVCNQKLFSVSGSENVWFKSKLRSEWSKQNSLRVFKDHFRAITAAWARVPYCSKVNKITSITIKDNTLAWWCSFCSFWLLPRSFFLQRLFILTCLSPRSFFTMPFPMQNFPCFLGFVTSLVL